MRPPLSQSILLRHSATSHRNSEWDMVFWYLISMWVSHFKSLFCTCYRRSWQEDLVGLALTLSTLNIVDIKRRSQWTKSRITSWQTSLHANDDYSCRVVTMQTCQEVSLPSHPVRGRRQMNDSPFGVCIDRVRDPPTLLAHSASIQSPTTQETWEETRERGTERAQLAEEPNSADIGDFGVGVGDGGEAARQRRCRWAMALWPHWLTVPSREGGRVSVPAC